MLCFLNGQSLDFKAESLEILEDYTDLDPQSDLKPRNRFRRRNQTIDPRVAHLDAITKKRYYLFLDLEKIFAQGGHLPEIGLGLFKNQSINDPFTKYDFRLLEQFFGNQPLNSEIQILSIARKVAENDSTQKLRLLSLYEICKRSQYSVPFNSIAARMIINGESQKTEQSRLCMLNEMRGKVSVVGETLTSLIFEKLNNRNINLTSFSCKKLRYDVLY